MTRFDTVRVAAIQATPAILDADASVDKAVRLAAPTAALAGPAAPSPPKGAGDGADSIAP